MLVRLLKERALLPRDGDVDIETLRQDCVAKVAAFTRDRTHRWLDVFGG